MEQIALTIVEDTPEVLKAKLKREWEAIAARKEAGEVDYDVQRAKTLTTYLGLGLSQKDIVGCVGINLGWIDQLLRYGRFMNFLHANACKSDDPITEGRFRRYWKETVDPTSMLLLRGKKNAEGKKEYEQRVFQEIAEKHMKGENPKEPSWKPKKTVKDIKPEQLTQLRKDIQSLQAIKRKEVKEVYTKIEEDVRALIELSGCSRSTYAPNILAMHAKRLKAGLADLQRVLKGNVDQWLLDVME